MLVPPRGRRAPTRAASEGAGSGGSRTGIVGEVHLTREQAVEFVEDTGNDCSRRRADNGTRYKFCQAPDGEGPQRLPTLSGTSTYFP